ncbi:MAG: glycosyltransferase family 1 protein [Erysipelotrichia bacterium]|nr:glycosyltransferase family 1 protein [Erysipelotrichia bacterium]
MDIAIFIADSNGAFPVPASKGGAVSTLVEHLIEGANHDRNNSLTVTTYYDTEAYQQSKKYNNVTFNWIKRPTIIKTLDVVLFKAIQVMFPKKKSLSYATLFSLAWYILKSSVFLKNNKFDKVVIENNIPLAWIIKFSKYDGDYYYHFHNVPRINAKCQSVFSRCKFFISVSNYVANELKLSSNAIGPIRDDQSRILYNCIDTNLFTPLNHNECREFLLGKYNIQKDKKIIIFTGRLSEEKGVDILLKACRNLTRDDFVVLIVGTFIQGTNAIDAYQNQLIELSNTIKQNVIFTGYISHSIMPSYYSGADIAVLPSMWNEPAGLTMIEAMACGVPVITTNSGGIPEYAGQNSIIIERNEMLIHNISEAINKLLDDGSYYNRPAASNRIKENFSCNSYFHDLVTILEER